MTQEELAKLQPFPGLGPNLFRFLLIANPTEEVQYVLDNICTRCHNLVELKWVVEIGDEFEPEFDELPEDVQDAILAHTRLLEKFGPTLGRPWVDTLKGSGYAKMKELRFEAADGECS